MSKTTVFFMTVICCFIALVATLVSSTTVSAGTLQCKFLDLEFPPDFAVIAVGGETGQELDNQIDRSGRAAGHVEVTVNFKSKPVIFIPGGTNKPPIWNIQGMLSEVWNLAF